mgnify:CR=1 FL=1
MIVKVKKWGNSLAIRIPQSFAKDVGMGLGTSVDVRIDEGRLVLEVRTGTLDLEALVARITPENRHGEAWSGSSRGSEAW